MYPLFTMYFFIIGLIFGSFFNVVGLRVPKGELFKQDRSYCPHCSHTLRWFELLPVFSFLIQFGRCRNCKERISPIYPIMEFISGTMFAFCYSWLGWQEELLLALLLMSMFHILVVSDVKYMMIPDIVLLVFFVFFLLYRLFDPLQPWWSSVLGGGVGLVGIALIIMMSRGGMGGGDMKLFGLLGFVLGLKPLLVTFFLSTLLGAAISGILMMTGVISRKKPIPFGPFIIVGASFAFFSGNIVIEWYLNLFF